MRGDNVVYLEQPRPVRRPGNVMLTVATPFMVGAVVTGMVLVETLNFWAWCAGLWRAS